MLKVHLNHIDCAVCFFMCLCLYQMIMFNPKEKATKTTATTNPNQKHDNVFQMR